MPSLRKRIKNFGPKTLLRSPLHRVMSGRFMLVDWTGRKTGKRYLTPVEYIERDGSIIFSTDDRWWRNFIGGAPVALWLRGRRVPGTATPITDPEAVIAGLEALTGERESYARLANIETGRDGRTSRDELRREVERGRVLVSIVLDRPASGGAAG